MRTIPLAVAMGAIASIIYAQDAGPRLAPEDFAILPWGGTPGDRAVLEEIRACGFNLAGFVSPEGVPAVAAAGLKCILSDASLHVGDDAVSLPDDEIQKRVGLVTLKFRDNPAVFGYYLRDEPRMSLYPTLARFAAAVRENAPRQLAYINLFPNVANMQQLGAASYAEYVESFITTVKPSFVSYDHYALMDDGSLKDGYFQNLETVRAAALKYNLPFWNIVLGNAHFHYAEPSEDGLRFQMYTTLAYGARGISYFTYFAPHVGNYRLAAIDQFGHKTPTWDLLRRVNLQIHRLGPTYIKLKSINVFHHPDVPRDCRGIDSGKVVAAVDGGSCVVGEFEGPESRPYALIVNKDLHKSAHVSVKFKPAGRLLMVSPYTGAVGDWGGEHQWLAPGQGVLMTVQP